MATGANGLSNRNTDKNKIMDELFFAVLLVAVSAVTFTLFYRQCMANMKGPGLYHADMKAYILNMQGLDSGYSFPYPLFFKLSAFIHLFTGPELAVAIATMLLNSLAIVIVKKEWNRQSLEAMQKLFPGREWIAGALISVLAVSLFFISMVFPPPGMYLPGIKHNYLGVFTANPFHNATYMAARPFAILAFLWFVKLLPVYESGVRMRRSDEGQGAYLLDYVCFSLFLLAATLTKPSFTLVMVATAGLIMLVRLIRSKGSNLRETIFLGLMFVPTFVDLLYQFNGVFVPEDGVEGGIGFCFGEVWGLYCDNIPLAVGLAIGFPILVLVLHTGEMRGKDALYRVSWLFYLMSFAMTFFLCEKGFRKPDFNFSWGYMYGIFFAFFGSIAILLRDTAQKKRPVLLTLQWLAFLWHLLCGLYYFGGIFQGKMYY